MRTEGVLSMIDGVHAASTCILELTLVAEIVMHVAKRSAVLNLACRVSGHRSATADRSLIPSE